jgi:hypothetical protein
MSNYSKLEDCKGDGTSYPSTPQFTIPFQPRTIIVSNDDTTNDVYVSFDGVNDHAHLAPNTPTAAIRFERAPYLKVWIREGGTTSGGTTKIQVIAEA